MSSAITWNGISLDWAYSDLLSHIRFKVTCPHRAKDVLHDAIIRYILNPNPDKQHHPKAYLGRIVDNLIIDYSRHQFHQSEYAKSFLESHQESFTPSVEHLADLRQRIELLTEIIQSLPPRCRQVFWMYRVEGLNQQIIAEKLNISLNMVERHMIRALLDLKAAKYLLN